MDDLKSRPKTVREALNEARTRITALEAQLAECRGELAIERAPKCFSCGATVQEDCPRSLNAACGREHLGGKRAAIASGAYRGTPHD